MQTILGLDFGSSNVTLVKQNEGVILKEANLVSVKRVEDGYVLNCVGNKASKFLGKNIDNIMTFSPVGFGEIVSPDYATILLKRLLDSVQIKPSILNKVKLVLVIPVGLSEDAKQKYIDLCSSVKIKDVIMVPSALVSAIGENINIGANSAKLVVDIGGGVIDCAVINLNHIVCGSTLALGGRTLDSAIVEYVQKLMADPALTWRDTVKKFLYDCCYGEKSGIAVLTIEEQQLIFKRLSKESYQVFRQKQRQLFGKILETFGIEADAKRINLFTNLSLTVMVIRRALPDTLPLFVPEAADETIDVQLDAIVDVLEKLKTASSS